jgi:uncharacterized membrane-anchored protein
LSKSFFRILLAAILAVSALAGLSSGAFAEEPPEINWIEGPAVADFGDVAQVDMDETLLFANKDDTRKLMEYLGEPVDDNDLGIIVPYDENEDWSVFFSYYSIGYIKDDEKADLDANAILDSIKEGTEEGNKIRIKNGASALNVLGWMEEPHYDSVTHNLTRVLLFEDADTKESFINHNTRLLGRGGYMAINLVTNPEDLAKFKPALNNILDNYSWKPGKSYAEFTSGDKVAEIGLTALIAGGAGAVAAKPACE